MTTAMKISIMLAAFLFFGSVSQVRASSQNNVEGFYRPVKSGDLVTKLPPRADDKSFERNTEAFTSETDGCPEQILIGGIDENTDIFGNVDIEVFIGDDVYIDCGRF